MSNLHTVTLADLVGEMSKRGYSQHRINAFLTPDDVGYDPRLTGPQNFSKSGLNVNALRQNANTLDYDEWKQIDDAVLDEARPIMAAAGDLMTGGLVKNLRDLGVSLSQYTRTTAFNPATVAMSVRTTGNMDRQSFGQILVPIPIIFQEFELDQRELLASRTRGEGLDTSEAREASITVAQAIEGMVLNGSTVVFSGNALYGYTTHPSANSVTTSADWGTVANVHSSVLDMISAMYGDNQFGPFGLYVNPEQYAQALQLIGAAAPNRTALSVLLEQVPDLLYVKKSYAVTAGTGVMVNLSTRTVDLAIIQNVATIPWEERGGMVNKFLVFAAMAPRVKADSQGRSGVVVHTNI